MDSFLQNSEDLEVYNNFEDLDLNDNILRGIYSNGFEKPSAIQQKAIKPLIEGHDIIAQAQSGTGKTATFCIGLLESLDLKKKCTQAIILSHTRELSNQIYGVMKNLSKYLNININLSVGGIMIKDNIKSLEKDPHIIIGTPGRILDMLNKNYIKKQFIKLLILDEADELLSDIFVNQIYNIFSYMNNDIQVALFSATMNNKFFNISKKIMRDPKIILVKNDELTLEGIRQYYINIGKNSYKYETFCDIYELITVNQAIIYCNTKKIVDIIANRLINDNFSISFIHGDMPQNTRDEIVKKFRNGESRILLTTDLLARGIDIQQISIVINYDLPNNIESYIHRIGRSGRYGRKGIAINFLVENDMETIKEIEKYYSTEIVELKEEDLNSL